MSKFASLAGFLALVAAPLSAQAVETLSLSFTGVTGGIFSSVDPYPVPSASSSTATFTGPVTVNVSIADYLTNPYVDHFSIQWGPASARPYTTGWQGTGFPTAPDPFLTVGYFSTVALTDTGGSIHIRPTAGYVGFFDGEFDLNIDYTLSVPQLLTGSYLDDSAGGTGSVAFTINRNFDPSIGFYDGGGGGNFQITSVQAVASVPEPAVWALMIVGFFCLGSALRAQRHGTRLAA